MIRRFRALIVLLLIESPLTTAVGVAADMNTVCEEVITAYRPANNGAGPMWCYGSPLIVRQGDTVSVSIIETGQDVPPLCNTRWQLWQRIDDRWQVVAEEEHYRQREPCPLAGFTSGELFLSVNPSTQPPGTRYGPCEPAVLRFDMGASGPSMTKELPLWAAGTQFTDHSYRGFAADAERREMILLNIHAGTSAQFVSYRDAAGTWHARGQIVFPIRAAYPQVALRNGAAHVLAIGDIVEPNEKWRRLKREHLKRDWDYVFRRLFYTSTPSISAEPFAAPLEVDTVEDTGGHITNLDLYLDDRGRAHLLYLKQPHVHEFLRTAYFPDQQPMRQLQYVTIYDGQVVGRRTLIEFQPNEAGLDPSYARFWAERDERLQVVVAGTRMAPNGQQSFVNVVLDTESPRERKLALEHPFRVFFTVTPRSGSPPSHELDLFGIADDGPNLRYAHIRSGPQ